MSTTTKIAVVLLSGGLDSSTALAWAVKEQGWQCHTVAFDYGQRHRIELEASAQVARTFGVTDHRIINVDLRSIGHSALTSDIPVPKDHADTSAIPSTYVPARNLIFLSLAAGLAEAVNATRLVIGANVVDYSGYPDCRPEFIQAFADMANLATKVAVEGQSFRLHTPLIDMSKAEIICRGNELGVDYSLTVSCYQADSKGYACGHCDACRLRAEGFRVAEIPDPTRYC